METVLALLSTPAGQALAAAGVNQVLNILGGMTPEEAAANFVQATSAYSQAVAAWEQAKQDTPANG